MSCDILQGMGLGDGDCPVEKTCLVRTVKNCSLGKAIQRLESASSVDTPEDIVQQQILEELEANAKAQVK